LRLRRIFNAIISIYTTDKETFISFDLAAKPPNRTKTTVLSLLPQAKNARCGVSNHATA